MARAPTRAELEGMLRDYRAHHRRALALARQAEAWDLDPKPLQARAEQANRKARAIAHQLKKTTGK